MTERSADFGLYTTLSYGNFGDGKLGIRTYHVPFHDRAVLLIPGFGRSSAEPKFRALAAELANRNVASATIDLNIDGRQKKLTLEEMLWDIERAELYLAHVHGWHISAYAGHSLGAALAMSRCCDRDRDERHFRLRSLALIAPALNQAKLLRYWFFRKHHPGASWQRFSTTWQARPHLEQQFLDERGQPTYAKDVLSLDLSFEGCRYLEKTLHIHGQNDATVPPESIAVRYKHRITIPGGDHDMETEDALDAWVGRTARHLAADHIQPKNAY